MSDYEKLLEQAYKEVKEIPNGNNGSRFEIPKLDVTIIGTKTVINNFNQACSKVRRKPEDICKFFSKELASMCKMEGDRLILNRKISEKQIQEKFKVYVERYVLCKQCKKPDTELIRNQNFDFIHCLACGAKHSLGRI